MFGEEVRAEVEAMESKEITKEAIMEEIQSDPALLDAIEKLTDSIFFVLFLVILSELRKVPKFFYLFYTSIK